VYSYGEERNVVSESIDSSTISSDNDPDVAPIARMLFSSKKIHPTIRPPNRAE